jgi:acetoin utilization deacetylase AcuC-like enzyme
VERSSLTVVRVPAEAVDRRSLLEVHDASFVDSLERFCAKGGGAIDADTYAVEASWDAALNAAGAGAAAVGALRSDVADVAFLAMRPPGHHAERGRAMGFCLFNNVAVTAAELARAGERIAIVDWDVHHGNGTQQLFAAESDVLYVSMHQHPFYPGTGLAGEVGEGAGKGTTVNLPMSAGADGPMYAEAFARVVIPIIHQFDPDWMLVSAGYDAHRSDPLAEIDLVEEDYGWMAGALNALIPKQRTVFFLEGGYNLDALSGSISATLDGHAGVRDTEIPLTAAEAPNPALSQIVETLAPYWDLG